MGFSNMNDMAKELNKMMSGGGSGMMGNTTSIKLDMLEYKKLGLSVGDKVFLDLTKAESFRCLTPRRSTLFESKSILIERNGAVWQ